jgi:septal ring factor EnvC (AmiA/AmiB activator)
MLIAVVSCLIGTSIFQTDALRSEMNAKFETVNQRIDTVNQRIDSVDKRMGRLEKSLEEIKKEIASKSDPVILIASRTQFTRRCLEFRLQAGSNSVRLKAELQTSSREDSW